MEQHERRRVGRKTKTGGGAAIDGNVDAGGDFTGRDAHEQNVNVHFPPAWNPGQAHGQGEGLSMADAQRLDAEIAKLRDKIGEMNALLVEVKIVMRSDTESREERTKLQERMINTFVDKFESEIGGFMARLISLELRASKMEGQRGKRDPLQIVGGIIAIVLLAIIAVVLIRLGGL